MSLATVTDSTNQAAPDLRLVVLRHADQQTRQIGFHTDVRAPKVEQIRQNPNVAAVLHSKEHKLQIQLFGRASIYHRDELAHICWGKTDLISRRCYMVQRAPGDPLSDADEDTVPAFVKDRRPTAAESADGFDHFAVIRMEVERIDWYQLIATGHRRAQFRFTNENGNQNWSGRWLQA
jgi:hypothetical protein